MTNGRRSARRSRFLRSYHARRVVVAVLVMAGVIQLAIVGLAYLRSWMNERETRVSTRIETPGPTIARAAAAREAAADLIEPTGRPSITLVTCYPFHWIGPAPRRFVVRGHAVAETTAAEPASRS